MKWWAGLGLAFLVFQLAVWIRWATSARFETTTFGRSEIPDVMEGVIWFFQITTVIAAVIVLWLWVLKPIVRERTFTLKGMLVVSFGLFWFWDPFINFTQNWVGYNTGLVNFGSWTTDSPGWVAPYSNLMGEPMFWILPTLMVVFVWITLLGAWIMRTAKARWPSIGKFGLVTVCFVSLTVFELVLELFWMRTGVYSYGGSIPSMTIFHGHYYQIPVYSIVFTGFAMAAFSSLVYFRNDKGETVVERGSDELRVSRAGRTILRFLAVVAFVQLVLVSYNVSMAWFGLRAHTWPDDVIERPYFTDGMCGPGTDYSCSGPGVPIPREASVHLGPEGAMVIPDGVTVRDESTISQ